MTNWIMVPNEGQGEPKRVENAERFMTEVETFIRGLRRWDWKTAVYDAEVQIAVMKLCEDPEFLTCLREEWSRRITPPESLPDELLTLLAANAPDVIAGFLDAVMCYMEKDKGSLEATA